MSDLPNGWSKAPVTEFAALHDNRRVPLNAKEREKMRGHYPYYGANGLVDHVNEYLFDGKYTLLAEDGGYFDDPKRGVAYEVSGKFWVNNHAHILEALGGISNRFLCYALNASSWMPFVGGTTRLKLTQAGLQQAQIALPPLPEQPRIVAKIDSLYAKSKRARDHLDHIPRLVEKYKQAILSAAFQGELTPTVTDWHQCTIADACDLIDGDRGPNYPKQQDYLATGYCLFLSTKNVRPHGFDFSECQFLSEEKHKTLRKGTLSRGDVVITTRGTIGNVAYYAPDTPYELVRINSGMLILRPNGKICGEYLSWYIRSPLFVAQIEQQRTGSAQPQLPAGIIKGFFIRSPDLPEQQLVVQTIGVAFAWINRLASEATSARKLIDHLDQAILAKAFRAELVPQDPTDEPASKLLERIRAERSSSPDRLDRGNRRRARKVVQRADSADKKAEPAAI